MLLCVCVCVCVCSASPLFLVGCLLGSLPKLGIKTETYGKREHGLNFMGRNEVYKLFEDGKWGVPWSPKLEL